MTTPSPIRLLIALFVFLVMVAAALKPMEIQGKDLGDFKIIYDAAADLGAGHDPYVTPSSGEGTIHRYVYPPYTLYLFRPFTYFSYPTAALIYLTAKLLLVGVLIFIWHRIFDFSNYPILFLVFVPLAYNGALLCDLRVGNVSIFEQICLWTGFYCYIRGRIAWFIFALVVGSVFKFVPILLLGLLAMDLRKKDVVTVAWIGGCALALLGLSVLAMPSLWSSFLANLHGIQAERGENNPSTWALLSDITHLVHIKKGLALPGFVGPAIYLILASATLYLSILTVRRFKAFSGPQVNLWRICLVCLVYAVLVPRFKNYSYILLIAPTFYLLISRLMTNPLIPLCLFFMMYTYRDYDYLGTALLPFFHAEADYFALLLAWIVWGAFCYSFLRKTDPSGPAKRQGDAVLRPSP